MRISDWSSDVCSSDLALVRRGRNRPMAKAGLAVTNCRKRVFADIRHGNRAVRHLWVPIGRHSGQHQAAVRMWELVKRVGELLQSRFLLQAMPVLVAMLVIVLPDHSAGADPDWGRLIWRTGNVGALLLPALAAHLADCSLPPWPAALVMFAGFVASPTVFDFIAGRLPLPEIGSRSCRERVGQ